jgi:hypothetical protein
MPDRLRRSGCDGVGEREPATVGSRPVSRTVATRMPPPSALIRDDGGAVPADRTGCRPACGSQNGMEMSATGVRLEREALRWARRRSNVSGSVRRALEPEGTGNAAHRLAEGERARLLAGTPIPGPGSKHDIRVARGWDRRPGGGDQGREVRPPCLATGPRWRP